MNISLKLILFSIFSFSIVVPAASAYLDQQTYFWFDVTCSEKLWRKKPLKDPGKMTTRDMMLALQDDTIKIVASCRSREPAEHTTCLDDLLSDNSIDVFNNIDRKILSYMATRFRSLRDFFMAYDLEKSRCHHYYSYEGLGFCIPYTGRECMDVQGVLGRKTVIGEGGSFCEIEEFLNRRGIAEERLIRGFDCRFM